MKHFNGPADVMEYIAGKILQDERNFLSQMEFETEHYSDEERAIQQAKIEDIEQVMGGAPRVLQVADQLLDFAETTDAFPVELERDLFDAVAAVDGGVRERPEYLDQEADELLGFMPR